MTWIIFFGDLLVMLFMVSLVTWLFMMSPEQTINESAMIPLKDETKTPLHQKAGSNSPEEDSLGS
jgi:cbb3-type cytochrome oxidase subunit 3